MFREIPLWKRVLLFVGHPFLKRPSCRTHHHRIRIHHFTYFHLSSEKIKVIKSPASFLSAAEKVAIRKFVFVSEVSSRHRLVRSLHHEWRHTAGGHQEVQHWWLRQVWKLSGWTSGKAQMSSYFNFVRTCAIVFFRMVTGKWRNWAKSIFSRYNFLLLWLRWKKGHGCFSWIVIQNVYQWGHMNNNRC